MPLASQDSLDVLCETGLWGLYLTLHTGETPTRDNALNDSVAPGYSPQPLALSPDTEDLRNTTRIVFGPAVREWPEIHSMAVRWGTPTLAASIVATVTLPHTDRHIVTPAEEYDIPAGSLRASITTNDAWHPTPTTLLATLRNRLTSATSLLDHVLGQDLDPNGPHADAWLRADYRINGPAGDRVNAVGLYVALFAHPPLDDLSSPLRRCHSDTDPTVAGGWPRDGTVPFYWSPLHHGLVNLHPVMTTTAASPGRATHWLASLGTAPTADDTSALLFAGPLDTPLDLAAHAGAGFPRRAFRLPMVL